MKKGMIFLAGAAAGLLAAGILLDHKMQEKDESLAKMQELYRVFDRWLKIRQKGKSLAAYFEQNHYRSLAVYGAKELGQRLYEELKGSNVEVRYMIDRNAENLCAEIEIVTPEEKMEPVDAVIVTAVSFFDEIKEALKARMDCPILSLEDILYEV